MSISLSCTRHYITRATSTTCRRGAPTETRNSLWSSPWSYSLFGSNGPQNFNYDSFENFTHRCWRKNALISNTDTTTLSSSSRTDCSKSMMHSILETIAINIIGRPFYATLNHPEYHDFPPPLLTSPVEIISTYVENRTSEMDLESEECDYLEEEVADDAKLPDNGNLWLISTLKRRKKKMNKHKLRKRRKKLRFKTRK